MKILQFFTTIIEFLVIVNCLAYLRISPKDFNNISGVILFGVASMGITLLAIIHPTWWTVGMLLYTLLLLRMSICHSSVKLWDFGHGYWYNLGKFQKFLRIALSWITIIIIIFISVQMIMLDPTWYVTAVYLPVIILTSVAIGLCLNEAIKSFD